MSARQPLARLLCTMDHSGLALDLHGHIEEDGYMVTLVTVPGTMVSVEADEDLRIYFSCKCDDMLPSAEELRKRSRAEMRVEHAVVDKYWLTH
jgi:hypothetical protein